MEGEKGNSFKGELWIRGQETTQLRKENTSMKVHWGREVEKTGIFLENQQGSLGHPSYVACCCYWSGGKPGWGALAKVKRSW